MHQTDKTIIQSLKKLRANLRSAMTPESIQQTIATFGNVREQLASMPALGPVLGMLASELGALTGQPSGELTEALTNALGAVEKFIKNPDTPASLAQLEHAQGELQNELGASAPPAQSATEAAAADSTASSTEAAPVAEAAEAAPEVSAEETEMLDGLIHDFLVESYENLDQLDRDLVALEQDPTSQSKLASIFRTIHTIKGTCGFFAFTKLESVAHVGESLLSRMRDGKVVLTAEIATSLLLMVDAVRQILGSIENERHEGNADYSQLIADLTRLQNGGAPTESAAPSAASSAASSATGPETPAAQAAPLVEATPAPVQKAAPVAAAPSAPAAVPVAAAPTANVDTENRGVSVADNSIRVDVGLLDVLMNLVGELVLARNQILQFTSQQSDAGFVATTQRLNLITSELQEGVMKTRLQPIGNIWSKFPRVVRDLSVATGKKISIELAGKETEMDKTIIEAIKDPLTHLVRNSADHGIELPDVRRAKGKPAEGNISLRAYHEGGQVNIEISDDGAGIDVEKVKARAVQRGLITNEQAARMSEREATQLIFLPGFSTAEKVTNISGRGVGMDVVRTNIEKIGGTLDIHNRFGNGTTIKIKIPLTLAIIPALIITTANDHYAIPQVSLLELVRLEAEQAQTSIEMIYGTPVYRLRGNLLPLVYLNRELKVEPYKETGKANHAVNIVVLRADDRQFGLVVDEINDTEEIVVKPLSKQLKGITAFAGATIMGDGKVALILDVTGIAQRARVVTEVRDRAIAEKATQLTEELGNRQTLLLFAIGEEGRMAIPLSEVARLEEFPVNSVEKAWQQEVVQYRGQVMPLLRLSEIFNLAPHAEASKANTLQVVVYSGLHRSVGLVVDQILDIVEESVTNQHRSHQPGVWGTAVIQQRVTDLLDVQGLIQNHMPDSIAQMALSEDDFSDIQTLTAHHALTMNANRSQSALLG